MESKIAEAAERALVEGTQRLTPEQRLNAFLVHCRLVTELYETGQNMRARGAVMTDSVVVHAHQKIG